uniref:Fibronectin type-III domain-containing protein n=1 Tax=Heliothis virescens TaxID=7102 RepID=A0A2A4J8Z4_HELVI
MKSVFTLFSVLLASFSHSVPLDEENSVSGLKAPKVSWTEVGPSNGVSFLFNWDDVVSDKPEDPVKGYTAYLWEIKKTKIMEMNYLTGKPEELETEPEMVEEYLPEGIPMIVTVPANQTYAYFLKLKMGASYQIRVKAYTKTREGPFSSPTRHTVINKSTS